MDFTLSAEQQLLKDSVARFAAQPAASRGDAWKTFSELGWLAIGLPEDAGGFGGAVETLLLVEQLGRGRVVSPYVSQVVFAGGILRAAERVDALESLGEGGFRAAVAYEEPQARYDPAIVAASAERSGDGWVLDGKKIRVLDAESAGHLILSARTPSGITLFLIPRDAAGVRMQRYPAEDGFGVCDVEFSGVRVSVDALLGREGEGLELLEAGIDRANAALCAEALGLAAVMLEMTVAYTKQRVQFGVPLSSFQALQHRMADMYVELELLRSMAYFAAMTVDSPLDPFERKRGVCAAKAQMAKSGRFIGQQAIQLHGGIGMSEEYDVGHYFKRMTVIERLLGDREYHVRRYADLRQVAPAALEPLSV